MKIINRLHHSRILGRIFHTLDYCLSQELNDCESVLDLGCGPSSPLERCVNIRYSVGIEAFEPYFKQAQKKEFILSIFRKELKK